MYIKILYIIIMYKHYYVGMAVEQSPHYCPKAGKLSSNCIFDSDKQ